ncbi:hypothetical protein Bca4012_006978 [Brassica carinata]|uniref:Uncharacterized protein n=1 Tax=Brassica carinata TaxID=52824 RepID=A0A8X7UT10_BRACI|nr:hypothetical protein Bca52824_037714 [Brassica carinata]
MALDGGDVGTEIICELLPVSVESGEFWFLVMVKLVEIERITHEFQSASTFSFLQSSLLTPTDL